MTFPFVFHYYLIKNGTYLGLTWDLLGTYLGGTWEELGKNFGGSCEKFARYYVVAFNSCVFVVRACC